MEALSRTDIAGLPAHRPSPRPERPVRLFCFALVWLVGASAAASVGALVIALVVGVHHASPPGSAHPWDVLQPPFGLLMLLVADAVLVIAGWRRGAAVGGGDARAGLGFGPIRRPGLLVALATLGEVAVLCWVVGVYVVLRPASHGLISPLLAAVPEGSVLEKAGMLLSVVVLSPLWEEFFFRGWLWTGLRQYWGTPLVMLATTAPWLALHMFDGPLRPLYLLPMAVMLCLARQYCGGIRASITLHVLNNLMAMTPLLFLPP